MAESIADRYRTRFPPKEHEEAVRMLLEGVESQQVEASITNNNRNHRKVAPTKRDSALETKQTRDRRMIPNNQYYLLDQTQTQNSVNKNNHFISSTSSNNNGDRRSLNSSSTATAETNSSSEVVESNNSDNSNLQLPLTNNINMVQSKSRTNSKSTSTSESISLKSSADSSETRSMSAMFPLASDYDQVQSGGDSIPSRTIAVQCDLKWSSVKLRDQLFDTSMQASSISSTKYGFYNYNYETLAKRHRIQRSTSYRNLINDSHYDDKNYDNDVPINRLESNGYNNDNEENRPLAHTDAPTSMSELSDESGEVDEKIANSGLNSHDPSRRKQLSSTYNPTITRKSSSASSTRTSNNHDQQQQQQQPREQNSKLSTTRGRQMYGSVMDNSTLSTSRARINSLPRRPMTALSYVSANKLRHQQQSDTESSDQDNRHDERAKGTETTRRGTQRKSGLSKARKSGSISHQNLVRPKMLASSNGNQHQVPTSLSSSPSNASSDSELNRVPKTDSSRNNTIHHFNRIPYDYDKNSSDDADAGAGGGANQENRRSEEMILTNGTKVTTLKNVHNLKPKLIETRHQEEVQDLNGMLEQFRRAESELRNNGPTNNATRVVYTTKYSTLKPNISNAKEVISKEEEQSEKEKDRSRFVGSSSTMSLPRKVSRRSHASETIPAMRPRQPAINLAKNSLVRSNDDDDKMMEARDSLRAYEAAAERRRSQVGRSISMRQVASNGPADTLRRYVQPIQQQQQQRHPDDDDDQDQNGKYDHQLHNRPILTRNRSQTIRPRASHTLLVNDDNSDAMESKTWSNPSGVSFRAQNHIPPASTTNNVVDDDDDDYQHNVATKNSMASGRKEASRSMSMRDITNDGLSSVRYGPKTVTNATDAATTTTTRQKYNPYRSDSNSFTARYNDEYSSSECSDLATNKNVVHNLAARLSPLDYDSQQRLNESGLPEVRTIDTSGTTHRASSHLGHTRTNGAYRHHSSQDGLQQQQQQQHRYTSNTLNGRGNNLGTQIKGRAMSQQSLTRPTMPNSANGRRLQQAGSGSVSSDVGGSSMSLATRLQGRYESAHTRSPIVMYIPPASSSSRASSLKGGDDSILGGGGKSSRSTLKRGSSRSPRTRSRHGSQDRSGTMRRQRSTSRNGSDSESSSILRTLVRSRGRESAYSSKRIARMHNIPVNNMIDTDDENMDGVGRLATEVDSYKFIRRYSVPKDAKINWFARLRQRVASGNR